MTHPAIRDLFLGLGREPAFQELLKRISDPCRISLAGLTTTAKALYHVLLWQHFRRPLLIVVDGNKQAEALSEALETFFELLIPRQEREGPQLLPALEALPLQGLSPHAEILERRAIGLWRLAEQRAPITVMPVASALLRLDPPDFYRQLALTLRTGDEVLLEDVVAHLESIGYERREPVEMVGEYSVRGGILDAFSPENSKPVRIELFGDQVETIRRFDVESQRSLLKIEECTLLPLSEYPRTRTLLAELGERLRESGVPDRELPAPGEPFAGWETLVPMARPRRGSVFEMSSRPIVIWDEPALVRGAAERFWKRLDQIERSAAYDPNAIYLTCEELEAAAQALPAVSFQELDLGASGETFHISTRPAMNFHGNMQMAIGEARTLVENGSRVAFFAATSGEV
ncbi:MAG TPA: hypothetical protein VG672_05235, partial [Bryobacteraceae bacterium]|nr:hypothetical protein [Bryobacteraceae bacterium]